ncbi:class I SAM-dependent methyltransferase [Luteimonas vadosa]|uniref:Methyltransferase domain-containing protein n=1 Tax=Luteimonas vadosa TaxID=1165507 RepID=A0ABP9E3Z5_9GAMM
MPGYDTHTRTLRFGEQDLRVRSLVDVQQYADPDGHAERAGISSAQWSLFGHVWPAGQLLAQAMAIEQVAGKRILELGCGLGLASLVLRQRGADITASDHHPLAEVFLAYNAALNDLQSVPFRTLQWDTPNPTLGDFDLIIGSDILYERDHARQVADLLTRHARASSQVLIADPGRGNSAGFTRALKAQGFASSETRDRLDPDDIPPFRGRLLRYRRD